MDILAACKDPGGMNGVLPVVKALRAMGLDVALAASGKAVEMLNAICEKFIANPSAAEIVQEFGFPKALVTSMCSGDGGIGRTLASLLSGSATKIFCLQDYWGGALLTSWKDCRPNFIMVNDPAGANIVQEAWPDFPVEQIRITGYPALDKYAPYDVESMAARGRSVLGVSRDKKVVLYLGSVSAPHLQSMLSETEILSEVVAALNEIKKDICFIPRQHPRMKNDAPEQAAGWDQALGRFNGGALTKDSSACDIPLVLASADVVLAMTSSTLVEAAVLRKEVISLFYPKMRERFIAQTAGSLKKFPLVSLGCAVEARNRNELCRYLAEALSRGLGLKAAQKKHFCLDGGNTGRVADLICSLI